MNTAKIIQDIEMNMIPDEKTKNGLPKKYFLEGTKNLCTDKVGYEAFEELKKQFVGKPIGARKMLRYELTKLYDALRKQGRLFRRDGTRI